MNSAAITVLAEAGIEGIDAEVALRRIRSELISPSEESRIRIGHLGLTMEEVDPDLHRLSEVVRRLVSAGLSETEASEIFGRRGTPAMVALMRGIDRFEELQKP